MVYYKFIKIVVLANLIGATYKAQSKVFKVEAANEWVYFYKKGAVTDSTLNSKNNQFFLVCKEVNKKNLLVYVENARFKPTKNDSLICLEYLPGLKYEAWFVNSEDSIIANGKTQKGKMVFTSFLNGTSQLHPNNILIQIYLKKENELLISNEYYYQD